MNDDFDFDDEFADDLADFEDFSDDSDDDVLVRTAVLQKNNMVALLCIKSAAACLNVRPLGAAMIWIGCVRSDLFGAHGLLRMGGSFFLAAAVS